MDQSVGLLNMDLFKRLEATEVKFLNSLAGYTLMERQRNGVIREELGVFNLRDKMRISEQNWYGHVCRMHNDRIPLEL